MRRQGKRTGARRRKKVVLDKQRREFLKQVGITTYGVSLTFALSRCFPPPAPFPVAPLPPITGALHATLEPVVAHSTMVAEPMNLTLTGHAVVMRVETPAEPIS